MLSTKRISYSMVFMTDTVLKIFRIDSFITSGGPFDTESQQRQEDINDTDGNRNFMILSIAGCSVQKIKRVAAEVVLLT